MRRRSAWRDPINRRSPRNWSNEPNRSRNLKARIILVTGANGGLGQAIVRNFLAESPDNFVWLGVRARRDAADRIVSEFSGRSECLDLEVTDPASWKSGVEKILARHNRL